MLRLVPDDVAVGEEERGVVEEEIAPERGRRWVGLGGGPRPSAGDVANHDGDVAARLHDRSELPVRRIEEPRAMEEIPWRVAEEGVFREDGEVCALLPRLGDLPQDPLPVPREVAHGGVELAHGDPHATPATRHRG